MASLIIGTDAETLQNWLVRATRDAFFKKWVENDELSFHLQAGEPSELPGGTRIVRLGCITVRRFEGGRLRSTDPELQNSVLFELTPLDQQRTELTFTSDLRFHVYLISVLAKMSNLWPEAFGLTQGGPPGLGGSTIEGASMTSAQAPTAGVARSRRRGPVPLSELQRRILQEFRDSAGMTQHAFCIKHEGKGGYPGDPRTLRFWRTKERREDEARRQE